MEDRDQREATTEEVLSGLAPVPPRKPKPIHKGRITISPYAKERG